MAALETWRIGRSKGLCAACGKELPPGRPLFSALREEGEGFARCDFCPDCWPAQRPEGFFCHWKTRRPEPQQKRLLDTGLMVEFFDRLEGAEAQNKKVFRFVIALYLMRRRELKLIGPERSEGKETLVFERRSKGDKVRVENPNLGEEQLQEAAAQLGSLLNADL
jgi:hypothetical protein